MIEQFNERQLDLQDKFKALHTEMNDSEDDDVSLNINDYSNQDKAAEGSSLMDIRQ